MTWEGIAAGVAVASLSGAGALLLLRRALPKPFVPFMQVFFGGMVGKLLLVGTASFLLLKFTSVHRAAYLVSLVICYLLFLAGEVVFLHRKGREGEKMQDDERSGETADG